jgi:hypothetical protein
MKNSLAKADLHLHSKASNLPGGWFSKLIGCPESFTEPMEIYKRLKERGRGCSKNPSSGRPPSLKGN